MLSSWTFGQRLGGCFALAALVLLAIAVAGDRGTRSLIENAHWVTHTYEVKQEIAQLHAELSKAESAARGYVIAENEAFLAAYRAAAKEVPKPVAALRRLIIDNQAQQRRLDQLTIVTTARLAQLDAIVDQRKQRGYDTAAATVTTGEGKRLMDQAAQLLDEMDREEGALLEVRDAKAQAASTNARTLILWGSLSGMLFVGVLGWFATRALTAQVAGAVRHIQSSSTELQSAANQQATGAKEQATAMNEITTTINELLATSRQIADSAKRVSSIAGETATVSESGDAVMRRSNESISGIKRQVDTIVQHMLDLGKKSQEIGGILEIINELAEQTNILAINASIEAAGAGELGRRFGVVAEEIRRLADRVGSSTKEIRELIDEVRAAVNTTVMATESGTKAVEAGARQFSEVLATFTQINDLVGTTTEAAREIELSTKQQSTAVEQVNVAVASVAQATRETEASSSQTLQTAVQLAGLSKELLRVVQSQSTNQS